MPAEDGWTDRRRGPCLYPLTFAGGVAGHGRDGDDARKSLREDVRRERRRRSGDRFRRETLRRSQVGDAAAATDLVVVHEARAVVTVAATSAATGPFESSAR